MDSVQIDWVMVIIAAILNMFIGFFWYSKWLFAPAWMAGRNIKHIDKPPAVTYLAALLTSFVIAYFLAFFEGYLEVTTVTDGMFVGFCLWLGFVMTTLINAVLWEKQPIRLFMIHAGYKLLSLLVMSGVIGA